MALARLNGGPLDGQIIPLEADVDDQLILPYGEGQLIYRREDGSGGTDGADAPAQTTFAYVEATEPIDPNADGRDD